MSAALAPTAPERLVPALDNEYALNRAQIAAFRRDGHVLLRGLCSPTEAAAFEPHIERALFKKLKETRKLEERDAYGRAFLQALNLRYVCSAVQRFVYARRFASVAARLLGVRAVRIYHEQALFKEGGGGPTPWHQDQYYWPLDTPNTVGLWMPLVDVTAENGALIHASRSHLNGFLGQHAISEHSAAFFQHYIDEHNLPCASSDMSAGDATFHYGWTLHSAPPNRASAMRKAMIVTYFADGARVSVPTNSHQENDRLQFLGGLNPGELANSELNPILYSDH